MAVCVPDGGAQGAAASAFSAAAPPIAISSGPSRASLIGLAVGLAVAGAALLAAVLLAAAYFALRARSDYPAGSGKRALLDPATPVRTAIRALAGFCGVTFQILTAPCIMAASSHTCRAPLGAQSAAVPGRRAVCHLGDLLLTSLICACQMWAHHHISCLPQTLRGPKELEESKGDSNHVSDGTIAEHSVGHPPKKLPCALGQLQRCGMTRGPLDGLTVDMRLVENDDGTLRKLGEGAYGQVTSRVSCCCMPCRAS